jgi:hypothetical protein
MFRRYRSDGGGAPCMFETQRRMDLMANGAVPKLYPIE